MNDPSDWNGEKESTVCSTEADAYADDAAAPAVEEEGLAEKELAAPQAEAAAEEAPSAARTESTGENKSGAEEVSEAQTGDDGPSDQTQADQLTTPLQDELLPQATQDLYYADDMEKLAREHENFSWNVALSDPAPDVWPWDG